MSTFPLFSPNKIQKRSHLLTFLFRPTLVIGTLYRDVAFFSGLRENQKQDKVDLGNDGEDDMTEDLNTLSALYDKIKSNLNSLNQ